MSRWGTTPRQSIEAACATRGREWVLAGCVALVHGDDAEPAVVEVLGGPQAPRYLDAPPEQRYWLRVWGARGLLWAPWTSTAAAPGSAVSPGPADWPGAAVRSGSAASPGSAVLAGLRDEHWRVREMALKVVARHRLDAAQPAVADLLTDEVARVRVAASRAARLLTA